MTGRVVFPTKTVGESATLAFPFASRLGVGVTISTKVVTCTVYSGVDAAPANVISGAAGSSGSDVTQKVTGGVLGVIYYLLCTITTSDSQTLELAGFLAVVPNVT